MVYPVLPRRDDTVCRSSRPRACSKSERSCYIRRRRLVLCSKSSVSKTQKVRHCGIPCVC
ncbi:hypothetical protein M378DRAFT_167066 [Amanita muscaria Koide BX008]|uniref:Uncharacterized protein n=1 Tax=Amanita muscaria (strain Koide BX008) TaxID=946122 RepID=A0A0C2WIC3_AMAMK|nr:hypothetical protein M378DRAFT_167066 [Amanita muscaria Koide BX008]